jgi:branched-chain amino acid aminotransferase
MGQEKEWIAYVNGSYVPQSQARVSIFDHGFLWGDGVYDTICTFNGYIMELERHLDRLYRSVKAFDLVLPLTRQECRQIIVRIAETNGAPNQYIKIIVTSGVGPTPVMDRSNCQPTVVVFSRPFFFMVDSADDKAKGIRTMITSIRRIPPQCLDPRAKNLNYANLVLAEREARRYGVDMAIMLDMNGFVNEAPGYNIFVVREGRVYTPPTENILPGVTRATIFDICEEKGIGIHETRLIPNDLYTADEVFLTSSIEGVTPVAEIDGRIIGSGESGPISRDLALAYREWATGGTHGTPFKTDE